MRAGYVALVVIFAAALTTTSAACVYRKQSDVANDARVYLQELNLLEAQSMDRVNAILESFPDGSTTPVGSPEFFRQVQDIAREAGEAMDEHIPRLAGLVPPARAAKEHAAIVEFFSQLRGQLGRMENGAANRSMTQIVQVLNWFGDNEHTGDVLYEDLRKALR